MGRRMVVAESLLLLLLFIQLGCLLPSSLACPYCPYPTPHHPKHHPPKVKPHPPPPIVRPKPPPVVKPPLPPIVPPKPPPVVVPPPPIVRPKPPPVVVPPPPIVHPKPPPVVVPPPPIVRPKPPPIVVPPTPCPPPPPKVVPYPPPPPPPPAAQTCPVDALKLGACVDLLGGLVHVIIGRQEKDACCPLLQGLADLDAALCLCTAIRAKLLSVNLLLPVALQLLVGCGKNPPPGYQCPP